MECSTHQIAIQVMYLQGFDSVHLKSVHQNLSIVFVNMNITYMRIGNLA